MPNTATKRSLCPICHQAVPPKVKGDIIPFCSKRCKSIDLGNWLSDDYRISVEINGADEHNPEDDKLTDPAEDY